ncbi:Ras-related protein Rab-34 [Durusdinium trenchii]|uniref:Ras-related protein Rab-34 n=1 Tax=Durusdinium trenchii TaxID=1381693 RepID=A0ABP0JVF8_9DINO
MADGGAANADAVISGALLTVAFGFLPCVAARQLLATTRQLKDLDREELWRQCYLSQYPERSCKAAVPSLWRLAMRQPQNGRICLDSSDPAIDSGAHDWQAAILVTGSPLSGKTWLVQRFCTGHPPEGLNKVPFLGTDLRVSRVQMRSQPSTFTRGRVRIWEPSGLSRQQALTGYLKAAQAVLVCLDVASDGPEDARRLLGEVTQSMRPGTIVGLGGLQVDKLTPRQQRQAFAALKPVAQEANAEFALCSARTGEGIEELFSALLAACLEAPLELPAPERVLNSMAGTLTSAQLLRILLHRETTTSGE